MRSSQKVTKSTRVFIPQLSHVPSAVAHPAFKPLVINLLSSLCCPCRCLWHLTLPERLVAGSSLGVLSPLMWGSWRRAGCSLGSTHRQRAKPTALQPPAVGFGHPRSDRPKPMVLPVFAFVSSILCTPIMCIISFQNCLQLCPATFLPLHPPVTTTAYIPAPAWLFSQFLAGD